MLCGGDLGALSNQDHYHSVRLARSAIAEDAQTLHVTGKIYIIVGIINSLNIFNYNMLQLFI